MSTATSARRKSSGSSAIAPYSCLASSACSGCSPPRGRPTPAPPASPSPAAAVRRCAASPGTCCASPASDRRARRRRASSRGRERTARRSPARGPRHRAATRTAPTPRGRGGRRGPAATRGQAAASLPRIAAILLGEPPLCPRLSGIAGVVALRAPTAASPEPQRPAAPRQPANGTARLVLRALAARALPAAHRGPRPARSRPAHEAAIIADLQRLGIDWDGLPCRQSERLERHRAAFEQLRATGRLYRCWCTRAEIREAVAGTRMRARAQRLSGDLPDALRARERARRERAAALRRPGGWMPARSGSRSSTASPASVAAASTTSSSGAGPDGGTPAYNLAVVVDDADQGIGEVVRGDDLLETTPRQILLARLLGLPAPATRTCRWCSGPTAADSPSATARSRSPERLALGRAIETVIGWMASSAGLVMPGPELSAEQVLAAFDPAALSREPTMFAQS